MKQFNKDPKVEWTRGSGRATEVVKESFAEKLLGRSRE